MNLLVITGLIISLLIVNGMQVLSPFSRLLINQQQKTPRAIPYIPQDYQQSPVAKPTQKPLNIGAGSAVIYDVSSSQRLFEKHPDDKRPIASLNKLMTALVILENHSPEEIVTIGKLPQLELADQKIGIAEGEQFKLIDLTKALLIYSANDVANALAIYDSGSIDAFATKMNNKAKMWNLNNSSYVNPSGLDNPDELGSANDVLTLATILIHNQIFREIVKTTNTRIASLDGKSYSITTTNKILGQGGVIGIKTGFTLNAGECLVTLSQREGHQIITIVLDSPDRFQESKSMIDWAFNNYIWQ